MHFSQNHVFKIGRHDISKTNKLIGASHYIHLQKYLEPLLELNAVKHLFVPKFYSPKTHEIFLKLNTLFLNVRHFKNIPYFLPTSILCLQFTPYFLGFEFDTL